jgi:hypothetical protein
MRNVREVSRPFLSPSDPIFRHTETDEGFEPTRLTRFVSTGHLTQKAEIFLRSGKFYCKISQFCAKRRESEVVEMPSVRNGMQGSETVRNSLGLNYKSAFEASAKAASEIAPIWAGYLQSKFHNARQNC